MTPVPEPARLAELESFDVLDTEAEQAFDDLVEAAAEITGAPTALIGLIDAHRQWYKAHRGTDVTEVPREESFCRYALDAGAPVVVPDASLDDRFSDHPKVTADGGIRFYAGFPLTTGSGAVLGTLCVVDPVARPDGLTRAQWRLLRVLADQVMGQLELRRTAAERERVVAELRDAVEAERRVTDEAVRRQALVDTVLDTVGVAIVACDAEGRLTLFNRTAAEFHGLGAEPGLGPSQWADRYDLYDEDGVDPLPPDRVPLLRALRGEEVVGVVLAIAPHDRARRVVRCHARAMHGPDGLLLGAVAVMSDITHSRAAAQQLAAQLQYGEALLESTQTAIWSFDGAGRPTSINRTARELTGWPDLERLQELYDTGAFDELLGRTAVLDPDGRPIPFDQRPTRRALTSGDTVEQEVVLVAPGRPPRTLQLQSSPLRGEDGSVSGVVLTGHDVTQLRSSESRFRAAFTDGPTPIAWLDSAGVVREVNPALRRLTSLRSRSLVGRALTELVSPDDRPAVQRMVSTRGRGERPVEVRLLRAGGRPLWCEMATTVSRASDGSSALLTQFIDVDARKTSELALERAATRDPLTGLGNRSLLVPRLEQVLGASGGTVAGLLFVDLDGFKAVNDSFGHEAGDAVLVEIARRLESAVRPDDTVLRLGGDEFVVVCALPVGRADELLEALRDRAEQAIRGEVLVGGRVMAVGASIGTAVAEPGGSADELLQAADRAMYDTKRRRSSRPAQP